MNDRFVADRVGQLRKDKGVSAREMSLSIGQAANYINNIENGRTSPSIQGLFSICSYLGVSPKDFFDLENDHPALLDELIRESRPLNSAARKLILELIRELGGKKA